jgi:hypothetical protein
MRVSVRVVAFLLVLVASGTWVLAQSVQPKPVFPTVISGDDIGFRMEGQNGSRPTGRLVVRINGQWVEPEFATGLKFITK